MRLVRSRDYTEQYDWRSKTRSSRKKTVRSFEVRIYENITSLSKLARKIKLN